MDEFYRRIKLKAQSQDTHKQADFFDEKYRFKGKDNKHWVFTKILHTIDTFKEATKKNTLISSLRKKRSYGNLTKKELGFMEQLKTPGDIIITSTVKAGPQLVKMLNNILE